MLNATDASTKQSPFVKSFQEDDEGADLKQTPEQWAKQSQFRFSSQFDSHVPDRQIPQFKTYQSEVKEASSDRNSNEEEEKTFKMESESDQQLKNGLDDCVIEKRRILKPIRTLPQ